LRHRRKHEIHKSSHGKYMLQIRSYGSKSENSCQGNKEGETDEFQRKLNRNQSPGECGVKPQLKTNFNDRQPKSKSKAK